MNKKLLAAAVAAAVASPVAFAESTVYGKFHTSIDAIDYDTTGEDNYEVNSRASRLGFKGSEDLGGGLKAIYQLELGFNSDGGGTGQTGGSSGLGTRRRYSGHAHVEPLPDGRVLPLIRGDRFHLRAIQPLVQRQLVAFERLDHARDGLGAEEGEIELQGPLGPPALFDFLPQPPVGSAFGPRRCGSAPRILRLRLKSKPG